MHLVLTLMMAAATPGAANGTPPGPHSLQQDFDLASADATADNCQGAIPKFEALEKNPKIKAGSLPAAAIAVRKGVCMVKLKHADIDEPVMQTALAILGKAGSEFDIDVANGWTALGAAAYGRYDYAGATSAYQKALALKKGEQRTDLLSKLANATAFNGNSESLIYAEQGIQTVSSMAKPDKASLAAFHTLHARSLLNQGNAQEAYKELKTALTLSGGLTNRTTLSDVALRGDLAMAAMLTGHKDDARLYLAYTGAGRIAESPFKRAVSMDPPICGEETGLTSYDVAVVEFGIADDGTVASAHTVYSRGGPKVAAAFGKAVSDWYWKPEDIAAIPLFYRLLTRVELRCSNVPGTGPGVMGPLRQRFLKWASGYLPQVDSEYTNKASLSAILHKSIDDSTARGDAISRIAALGWLADAEPASGRRRVANVDEALNLAAKALVPQEVVNWLRIQRLLASTADKPRYTSGDLDALAALSSDSTIAADALAADTLMLSAARGRYETRIKKAPALLQTVAQDDRLPDQHPLRQLAWLELAGKAADEGDRTKAQDYFKRTGLSEEQCALLGEAPAIKRTNASGNDYPMEALMMGFEGWVTMEYDITTNGKTVNARPLVAYPPLIFVDAATGMAKDLQYNVSYRPGNSLACSAEHENFSFVIPQNR